MEVIEGVSIVVVGSMNPNLHHPLWYLEQGALSQDEHDAAMSGNVVCSDGFSQFGAPSYQINCIANRWTIRANSFGELNRVVDVAAKVFEALEHTPLQAFGFNYDMHRETQIANFIDEFTDWLKPLGIFEDDAKLLGRTVAFNKPMQHGQAFYRVEPSERIKNGVFVGANVHYELSSLVNGERRFDARPYLERCGSESLHEVQKAFKRILVRWEDG